MQGKSIFISIVMLVCAISPIYLAQQVGVQLEELSKGADIILTGRVTQQSSSWNEDKSRIYTIANIQVEEYIKGNAAGNIVSVKYLGGEVGDVGELYSHMPRFEDKEEVLVFLTKDGQSSNYKVFNGADGKINVVEDQKTGEKITTSNVKINSLKAQIKSYINE